MTLLAGLYPRRELGAAIEAVPVGAAECHGWHVTRKGGIESIVKTLEILVRHIKAYYS